MITLQEAVGPLHEGSGGREKPDLLARKIPEGFRRLEPVCDVTERFIKKVAREHSFVRSHLRFKLGDIYKEYWGERLSKEPPTAVAVQPDLVGAETNIAPASLLYPGLLESAPSSNTLTIETSRTCFLKRRPSGEAVILKGIGRQFLVERAGDVSQQFGKSAGELFGATFQSSWDPFGGLDEKSPYFEVANGYAIAGLYRAVFGAFPAVRLPKRIVDITRALRKEGAPRSIKRHYQIEFEVPTPVRTIACQYIADLPRLWKRIDLSTLEGKERAVAMLNDLLSEYPRLYSKDVRRLTVDEAGGKIFNLIDAYREALAGSETKEENGDHPAYSVDELTTQARLQQEIINEGYEIARRFYLKNEEVVDTMLESEAKKLGSMLGFSLALGLGLGSVGAKDNYGGMIADLDAVSLGLPIPVSQFGKEISAMRIRNFPASLSCGLPSMLYHSSMHGLDSEKQAALVVTLMKHATVGFRKTVEKIAELPIDETYKRSLKAYHRVLAYNLFERNNWSVLREADGLLAAVVMSANADLYRKHFGVSIGGDVVGRFAVPRCFAQEITSIPINGERVRTVPLSDAPGEREQGVGLYDSSELDVVLRASDLRPGES
jgi:hypothetical protein